MKYLITTIVAFVSIYLLFSFVNIDINFVNWTKGTRVGYAISAIAGSLTGFFIVADIDWKDDDYN